MLPTTSPPAQDAVLPTLVEVAAVDSLTLAMVQIGRATDHLTLFEAADWSPLPGHPDLAPHREAILAAEGFHESLRNLSDTHTADQQFVQWLRAAEQQAQELSAAVATHDKAAASKHWQLLGNSCQQCHSKYRN